MLTAAILLGFAILLLAFLGAAVLAGQLLCGLLQLASPPRNPPPG